MNPKTTRQEAMILHLVVENQLTPAQEYKIVWRATLARSRSVRFCECRVCPLCIGRRQAAMDNIADEVLAELEQE